MTPSLDRLEQGRANLLRVGGRNEFLCVDVPFEQASLHKRGDTRLDHQRRTTKIGFVTSEIATEVAVRHPLDEPALSCPGGALRIMGRDGPLRTVGVLSGGGAALPGL